MLSTNFEFLRPRHAELADLGGFAEQYTFSDPASALIKLRSFAEHAVAAIYEQFKLPLPYSDNLNDQLTADAFTSAVPRIVRERFHIVRIAGNRAAHPRRPITSVQVADPLRAAFDVGRWLHLAVDRQPQESLPAFATPTQKPNEAKAKVRAALEQARLAEVRLQAALAQLERERELRVNAEPRENPPPTGAEQATAMAELQAEGQGVANILRFDEATTRHRLIDQALLDAGWDVGPKLADTEQVKREVELWQLPTESGHGFADYVLYGEDGKALAVVEAKRTAIKPDLGAEQARLYAVGLERLHGVRPIIFFTNGLETFIWDDVRYPSWRRVYGFYSKDSLEALIHQRDNAKPLATIAPDREIAGRMYQLEAIRRVCDRFDAKFRKALIVQATGTGKTRVAVSLAEALMRAGWVKRILFLCDRRELRRQADDVFKEFLKGEPRVVIDATTSSDRDKRIYLATYPAMMAAYESFDVGFFDLIIADESHRSIYRKFRAPFLYFDALQVGLTATPVKAIDHNTFGLFGCEDNDPTSHFSLQDALGSTPPYLVPFRVRAFDSKFRRDGIKYAQMSAEQKAQADDEDADAASIDYDKAAVDKEIFNPAMTRRIWGSLMAEGLREETMTRVGKTIVFARNHLHAHHLLEVFLEDYPTLGADFCRVIDSQESRAEELLRNFKDPAHALTIAVSVDMLDTGIDVPEVVNLVFAKPVWSFVKFWQMIGRGTRLRPNLFGAGRPKTEFLIFDHWGNFKYFDEEYREEDPTPQPRSLLQRLFEARLELAQAALDKLEDAVFQGTALLLFDDTRAVADSADIEARAVRSAVQPLADRDRIAAFEPATVAALKSVVAPLMHVRSIRGEEDAYRFDLLMTQLQTALLAGGPEVQRVKDLRGRVQAAVASLAKNQNPVKAKAASIQKVQSKSFWTTATAAEVDELRDDLRGIMRFQQGGGTGPLAPRVLDVMDIDETAVDYVPRLEGLDLITYRHRVEGVLKQHFDNDPTLLKVRDGQPVDEPELRELARLVMEVDDRANVLHLVGHDPATRRSLLSVFRGLAGLDPEAVARAFEDFMQSHGGRLSAQQLRFLQLLQNHIAQNGGIELSRLYEPPFTTVHTNGVDGVFTAPEEVEELLAILIQFAPQTAPPSAPDRRAS